MSISTILRGFVPAIALLAVAGALAACSGAQQSAAPGVPQADAQAFPGPVLRSGGLRPLCRIGAPPNAVEA